MSMLQHELIMICW